MKSTQKNVNSFLKQRFDAFQIKPNGTRGTHYGNLNAMMLLRFFQTNNAVGNTVIVTKAGIKLHGLVYPELGVMEASSFSMRDTDFVNKIKVFQVQLPNWEY